MIVRGVMVHVLAVVVLAKVAEVHVIPIVIPDVVIV